MDAFGSAEFHGLKNNISAIFRILTCSKFLGLALSEKETKLASVVGPLAGWCGYLIKFCRLWKETVGELCFRRLQCPNSKYVLGCGSLLGRARESGGSQTSR